jgi:hypothetical protein
LGTGDNVRDQLFRNVREVGGGRRVQQMAESRAATAEAAAATDNAFEMSSIRRAPSNASSRAPPSYSAATTSDQRNHERTIHAAASLLFPNANASVPPSLAENRGRGSEPLSQQTERRGAYERTSSTGSDLSMNAPPQQIRSMLDV